MWPTDSAFIANSQLTTRIHWPCLCTVHVFGVIYFCDSILSLGMEANVSMFCSRLFIYCRLWIQISRGEGWERHICVHVPSFAYWFSEYFLHILRFFLPIKLLVTLQLNYCTLIQENKLIFKSVMLQFSQNSHSSKENRERKLCMLDAWYISIQTLNVIMILKWSGGLSDAWIDNLWF